MMHFKMLFLSLMLSPVACESQDKFSPVEATDTFRKELKSASHVLIYEGLPHQKFEPDLYQKESLRTDILTIAGHPFYIPATMAGDFQILKRLLGNPESLIRFRGEKLCGGFHPDYCVSWAEGGNACYALICFGCQEIIFSKGNEIFRYDIEERVLGELKQELSKYKSKRP